VSSQLWSVWRRSGESGPEGYGKGGLYIGSGIAPRVIPTLQEPMFMSAFTSKEIIRPLLEAMPVRIILQDKVGLFGAARYAILHG
jgi:glucokinase